MVASLGGVLSFRLRSKQHFLTRMIPREILKKIRQIELRTNRLVTGSAECGCARIPTGFCPKAQGCEARATLGQRPQNVFNRNAVAAIPFASTARDVCHNPVGVVQNLIPFTQGSSFVATLGWRTQSPWDWANRANSSSVIHQPSKITATPTGLRQPT